MVHCAQHCRQIILNFKIICVSTMSGRSAKTGGSRDLAGLNDALKRAPDGPRRSVGQLGKVAAPPPASRRAEAPAQQPAARQADPVSSRAAPIPPAAPAPAAGGQNDPESYDSDEDDVGVSPAIAGSVSRSEGSRARCHNEGDSIVEFDKSGVRV